MKDNFSEIKKQLRKEQLKLRDAVFEKEKTAARNEIIRNFMGNVPLKKSEKIGGYSAVGSEIDIRLLLEVLMEQGHICSLPAVVGKDSPLVFRKYEKGMQLEKSSYFDVYEPPDTSPVITPSIVIVPLLAFDKDGYRLGYGGGFYDRTLAIQNANSDILNIGVGYSFQQVAKLPHDIHDQRLDSVITEKGIVVCR